MKRFLAILGSLVLVCTALTGCSGQPQPQQQVYNEATQYIGPVNTPTPEPVYEPTDAGSDSGDTSLFASNPYDVAAAGDPLANSALSEEDTTSDEEAEPVGTIYPYAGSTPIPLDPIDMPTPTPRGEISFVYTPYYVQSLGLTFEGPAGWLPDETVSEAFTLTEPAQQMKDGQLGTINIFAVPTTADYSLNELKAEVKQRATAIGSTNFTDWNPSLTAERYLMGSEGIYMNFSGTMVTGIKVGGRIHATCRDKKLYVIQITYPLEYKEDFLNVFSKLRETIKRSNGPSATDAQ